MAQNKTKRCSDLEHLFVLQYIASQFDRIEILL